MLPRSPNGSPPHSPPGPPPPRSPSGPPPPRSPSGPPPPRSPSGPPPVRRPHGRYIASSSESESDLEEKWIVVRCDYSPIYGILYLQKEFGILIKKEMNMKRL